jgi:uncharacterized protein
VGIETHRISLQTVDGLHLDGDLAAVDGARAAAVLCHPHPLYGGDRFNPVIDALFDALPTAGITALRFDFRGVGESDGEHGGGSEEQLDVAAAVDLLGTASDAPLWVVGYSFGAVVALATMHTSIDGWVAIAPPLAMLPGAPPSADDHRPVHLIVPRHDQYSDPDAVAPIVRDWRNTSMTVVESADHFLNGHTRAVADLVIRAIG